MPSRVLGLIDYLKTNPDVNCVIFDDGYYNDYRMMCLNYYGPSSFVGLTQDDLNKIDFKPVNLNNFKFVNYRYRNLGAHEIATNNLIRALKRYRNRISE